MNNTPDNSTNPYDNIEEQNEDDSQPTWDGTYPGDTEVEIEIYNDSIEIDDPTDDGADDPSNYDDAGDEYDTGWIGYNDDADAVASAGWGMDEDYNNYDYGDSGMCGGEW